MGAYRFSIRDHFDAATKMTGIEGWQAHTWSACVGGSIVKGCVPSGIYRSGPRKGHPKFKPGVAGTDRQVIVSEAQLAANAAEYEKSGKCWDCKGERQTWCGWSKDKGHSYRDCTRCGATGAAP